MKKNLFFLYLFFQVLLLTLGIGINTKAQQCPAGLVSYWQLEETTDTIFRDYFGSNDASTSSAPSNDLGGVVGNAKSFNGSSNYINVPDDNSFDFTSSTSFTVEFWAKFTDAATAQNLIMIGRDDPSNSFLWWVGALKTSGYLNFELMDNAGNYYKVTGSTDISDGNWQHIVAEYNATTNKILLYRNGNLVGETSTSYTSTFAGDTKLNIGYLNYNNTPGYYFNGSLDEIAIYNTALDETTIDAHFASASSFGMGYCDDGTPRIISSAPSEATINQLYTYDVNAVGYPTINFELVSYPTGMTINSSTGEISWTPTSPESVSVEVRAYKGAEADTQKFFVYVSAETTCPTSLKNLWKLDESSGSSYTDFKGNNDGHSLNSPSYTSGIIDGAQLFDGVNDSIYIDNPDSYNWAKDVSFTISCWIKTTSNSTRQVIVARDGGAGSNLHMWLGIWETGEAVFYLVDALGNYPTGTTYGEVQGGVIQNDTWHNLVAVRDNSTQKNLLYVDGTLVAETDPYAYDNSFGAVSGESPLTIGFIDLSNKRFFNGAMDEIAIFERALSDSEISDYYLEGVSNGKGFCPKGNFAPAIITEPNSLEIFEDDLFAYNFECQDIDAGDAIIITADKPDWLAFDWNPGEKTAIFSGTPLNENVGKDTVTITVNDGSVDVTQEFILDILNVNDIPVITSTEITSAPEGEEYSYTFTATDIDETDVIDIFSESTLPDWLSLSFTPSSLSASALLAGTPGNDDIGDVDVVMAVTDGTDTVKQSFTIVVSPTNDKPLLSPSGPFTIDEDASFEMVLDSLNWSDVDNLAEDITIVIEGGNNYTLSGLTILPDENYNGTLILPTYIMDSEANSDTIEITINVISVNDAPIIESEPVTGAVAGVTYAYVFSASDADGTEPELSAIKIPSWLSFTTSNVLTGSPTYDNVGTDTVILRASDGIVDIDQEFIITISSTNNKPQITSTAINQVDEDSDYSYTITATDGDDDPLTYTATTLPNWLTFDSSTQELTGTPSVDDVGEHNVVIAVSDGKESVSQEFIVTVASVDDAPVIVDIVNPIEITNDSSLLISLDMIDVTDEDNTYPDDFTINVYDGNNYTKDGLTITPNSDFEGTLSVSVVVNDGSSNSNVFALQITVTPAVGVDNSFISEQFKVYPIPTKNVLNISIDNMNSNMYELQIIDLTGKMHIKTLIEEQNQINVESLLDGMYILKIIDGQNQYLQTIIIQK